MSHKDSDLLIVAHHDLFTAKAEARVFLAGLLPLLSDATDAVLIEAPDVAIRRIQRVVKHINGQIDKYNEDLK